MKSVELKAYPRTLVRRGGTKKLRNQGRIPAVIYGRKSQPLSLEVEEKEFGNLLHHALSENLVVDLTIENDSAGQRLALLQEIQHNPVSGQVLHVDFHEVDANEPVEVSVPLETEGEAVGVKQGGGVLEHVLFKIRVRALPRNLPAIILVDVSNLNVGDSVHLKDIVAPEGVEILGERDVVAISVIEPRTAEEETPTAAAAPGAATLEPEMIKEKKEAEGEGKKADAVGKKPEAAAKK
ncbi:MAG TPA: 50S ribosomal protein L25 [Verrucomicrobiales bacterium]|nr:50S ribosomal protein L25 [Verrucomicrobiales bacterium]